MTGPDKSIEKKYYDDLRFVQDHLEDFEECLKNRTNVVEAFYSRNSYLKDIPPELFDFERRLSAIFAQNPQETTGLKERYEQIKNQIYKALQAHFKRDLEDLLLPYYLRYDNPETSLRNACANGKDPFAEAEEEFANLVNDINAGESIGFNTQNCRQALPEIRSRLHHLAEKIKNEKSIGQRLVEAAKPQARPQPQVRPQPQPPPQVPSAKAKANPANIPLSPTAPQPRPQPQPPLPSPSSPPLPPPPPPPTDTLSHNPGTSHSPFSPSQPPPRPPAILTRRQYVPVFNPSQQPASGSNTAEQPAPRSEKEKTIQNAIDALLALKYGGIIKNFKFRSELNKFKKWANGLENTERLSRFPDFTDADFAKIIQIVSESER